MTIPPVWKPGSVLRASDLVALEGYLACHQHLLSGGQFGYGIVEFPWRTSLQAQVAADNIDLQIRRLTGIARNGLPVWIGPEHPLHSRLSIPDYPDGVVRLTVEVNPQKASSCKYLLRAEPEHENVPQGQQVDEGPNGRGSLDLGTYRLKMADGPPECVRVPVPFNLRALAHYDAELPRRVHDSLETQFVVYANAPNARQAAAVLALIDLAMNWDALPLAQVAQLVARLQFLRAERGSERHAMEGLRQAAGQLHSEWTHGNTVHPEAFLRSLRSDLSPFDLAFRPANDEETHALVDQNNGCTFSLRFGGYDELAVQLRPGDTLHGFTPFRSTRVLTPREDTYAPGTRVYVISRVFAENELDLNDDRFSLGGTAHWTLHVPR